MRQLLAGIIIFSSKLLAIQIIPNGISTRIPPDPSTLKFITYCPCMGRFGNQAEQMLGAISLAKGTNRSLLIPPFTLNDRKNNTYSSIFSLKRIQMLLPGSMDLQTFMEKYSSEHWPQDKREILCYTGAMARSDDGKSCPYQYGEPFTSFWKQFSLKFENSRAIDSGGHLSFKPAYHEKFKARFDDMKVMAFFGNPGSFPSIEEEQEFQKYIQFNKQMEDKVRKFMWKRMGGKDDYRVLTEYKYR